MPPISRTVALASMLLSLGACHAHFQANARTSTASGSQATASSNSNASAAAAAAPAAQGGSNNGSTASFQARGSAQGSLRVRAQGSGQGTASAQPAATPPSDATTARTVTAAPRPITFTAPPRPQIQPAQQPPAFRGRVMIASRRASRARGRTPTPPPVVTAPTPVAPPAAVTAPTPVAPPTTTPVAPPVVVAPPVAPPVVVEPPVIAAPEPAPPAPPAAPIPAPSTPPENVFGYDRPVLGCFEGQVYFIPENSERLPRKYNDLESSAVLYACEWDIPTRAWEQGFPGLSDRFEWFAIRYEGAFNITTAGNYRFRLSSDDGAKVTIDGRVVIDNDGVHAPEEKSGQAQLSAGDHTMVIEYFQGPRYHINLQLFVTPPDGQEGVFSVRPQ